jgi:hypothetical protein
MADQVSIEELRANLDAILRRGYGGEHVTSRSTAARWSS